MFNIIRFFLISLAGLLEVTSYSQACMHIYDDKEKQAACIAQCPPMSMDCVITSVNH